MDLTPTESGIPPENTFTHPVLVPQNRCGWEQCLSLRWTPGEHGFGVARPTTVPTLLWRTQGYTLFLCDVWGRAVHCSPQRTFLLEVCYATCLWNIFFSYLRDKWDLHFPLNTKWLCLCFSPRISDIWSNANLFSYLTFSNNWALALAELVPIISERKSPHFYSVAGEQEGRAQCY